MTDLILKHLDLPHVRHQCVTTLTEVEPVNLQHGERFVVGLMGNPIEKTLSASGGCRLQRTSIY